MATQLLWQDGERAIKVGGDERVAASVLLVGDIISLRVSELCFVNCRRKRTIKLILNRKIKL